MDFHEQLESQRAAVEAEARRRANSERERSQRAAQEKQQADNFLREFVAEAQRRGIRPERIPYLKVDGGGNSSMKRSWTKRGWVVYLTRSNRAKFAIGEDATLYDCATFKPVNPDYYYRVPWSELTRVVLGHPPAMEPPSLL